MLLRLFIILGLWVQQAACLCCDMTPGQMVQCIPAVVECEMDSHCCVAKPVSCCSAGAVVVCCTSTPIETEASSEHCEQPGECDPGQACLQCKRVSDHVPVPVPTPATLEFDFLAEMPRVLAAVTVEASGDVSTSVWRRLARASSQEDHHSRQASLGVWLN